ncbi:glycosyltransferase family 2 protein [Tessaracoccus sp. Y1736]
MAGFKRFVSPEGEPMPGAAAEGLQNADPFPLAPACNLAITRHLLLDIGGFDESLPRYGFEDTDLYWRLQDEGYPLAYAPDARIAYYISNLPTAASKVFQLARGRMLMAKRHPAFDPSGHSLLSCIRDIVRRLLNLPMQLLFPGAVPSPGSGTCAKLWRALAASADTGATG